MKKNDVKNVIVLMFDSLQYNYLGCNGNDWIKTPNFDRFARESVVFDEFYIEGLPTIPCRRAMHTGRYTLPVKGWSPLDMDDTTIADLCWGKPIDTAMIFDSAPQRLPKFGYTRAFDKVYFLHGHEVDHFFYRNDEVIHLDPEQFMEPRMKESMDKAAGEKMYEPLMRELVTYLGQRQYWKSDEDQNVAKIMKQAVRYLEEVDRDKSFFLWVDNFDPHEPWDPPSVYDPDMKCPYDPDYKGVDMFLPIMGPASVYTEEELHHIRMLYAEKVSVCDKWLGYFMENVKRLGFDNNTLCILLSDHGEPMGHGEHGHGIMRKCRPWPYEELVHGICMMRGPGLPVKKRVSAFTQSCDIAPTVCSWLGLGVHESHQGKDLLPLAMGEVDKVRDFAIAGYYRFSWSIITEEWSYIHWLRKQSESAVEARWSIYRAGLKAQGCCDHLGGVEATNDDSTALTEEARQQLAEASLDGEDQWTCVPGSEAILPEDDELYCRKTDRFQLKNVIKEHPDVAKDLLRKLKTFMSELKAS